MQRSAAAQVLGIQESATRGAARIAYMELLQRAANDFSADSVEFSVRRAQLKDAYAAFGDAEYPTNQQAAITYTPAASTGEARFLGRTIRAWALTLLVASLFIAFFTWSLLSEDQSSPTATESSSATNAPQDLPQEIARPTATPSQTPDNGQSGLLNTCWRDEAPIFGESNEESTPVTQVDCSGPQAQWLVYKEARFVSQCNSFYLTTDDGWTLCIRPM
jgi:hypothetical protein